jgi:zinc transporter 9
LAAILAEDAAAVLGLLMAIAGIALEQATGSPLWDAAATLSIGILLALVAIFLIRANRSFLLTKAVSPEVRDAIEETLDEQDAIEEVKHLQAVITAMGQYRVSAQVDFDGRKLARDVLENMPPEEVNEALRDQATRGPWLEDFAEEVVNALSREVDAVEAALKARIPEASQVDLESD